jgi:hypothetical protein
MLITTEDKLKIYSTENMVSGAITLHVYEGDYRLYSFKELKGTTMFMGNYKYTYSYSYQLFRGEKFLGESKSRGVLFAKTSQKLKGLYK